MAVNDVTVQLRLLDSFSGPMGRAAETLNRFKGSLGGLSGDADRAAAGLSRLARAHEHLAGVSERAAARMQAAKAKAIAAGASILGMGALTKGSSDYQLGVMRLLQIDEWDTKAIDKGLQVYRKLNDGMVELTAEGNTLMRKLMQERTAEIDAVSKKTGQSSAELLKALTIMVGQGLEQDVARKVLGPIGYAATASGAGITDLGQSAFRMYANLRVAPDQMLEAFNILHKAGKVGGFELKDSAQWFPVLGAELGGLMDPRFEALKKQLFGAELDAAVRKEALDVVARLAAQLEIAHIGAPSAGDAATNLKYLLGKSTLQETALHFRKYANPYTIDLSEFGVKREDFISTVGDDPKTRAARRKWIGKDMSGPDADMARETGELPFFDFDKYLNSEIKKGVDPILAQVRLATKLVEQTGNWSIVGKIWNDHMAKAALMPLSRRYRDDKEEDSRLRTLIEGEGLDPSAIGKEHSWNKYIANIRDAGGTVMRDYTTSVKMLSYQFGMLGSAIERVQRLVVTGGALDSMGTFFDTIRGGVEWLETKLRGNQGMLNAVAPWAFGAVGLMAAAPLIKLVGASMEYVFARAGMGLISMARIVPGLGAGLGMFGRSLGFLGKLGLIGGAGFLTWQYWDQIKAAMGPVIPMIEGVLARLGELFPGLAGSARDFGATLKGLLPDMSSLAQVGKDLMEGFGWLFGAAGDKGGFARAGEGIMNAMPGLKELGDWASRYRDDLTGRNGILTMLGAWGKGIGYGFLGVMTGMTAMHGLQGLIVTLMGARVALFAVTSAMVALAATLSFLGVFIAPLWQAFLDKHGAKTFSRLAGSFGILALLLHKFGLQGVMSFWTGFTEGFKTRASSALSEMTAQFNRLWEALFGPSLTGRAFEEWIADITGNLNTLGRVVGDIVNPPIQVLANAFRKAAEWLEYWRRQSPESFEFVTGWAGKFLMAAASIAFFASMVRSAYVAVRWLSAGLLTLSGLRFLGTGLAKAFGFAAGGAGMAAIGMQLHRLQQWYRIGGLGAVLARGSLLGMGPIGWFFMLAGAIWLVVSTCCRPSGRP